MAKDKDSYTAFTSNDDADGINLNKTYIMTAKDCLNCSQLESDVCSESFDEIRIKFCNENCNETEEAFNVTSFLLDNFGPQRVSCIQQNA